MHDAVEETFDVINLGSGTATKLTRVHPVVGGVRMLASEARTLDGVRVLKYDDGIYRADDGRSFRESSGS